MKRLTHNITRQRLTSNIRTGYKSVPIPGVTGDELVSNGDFHDFTPLVDANTVALWVFDDVYHLQEGTGKTALQDLSGNGHDLTPSAGFDWQNSFVAGNPSYKNGNGLKFDGVDDYGYIPVAQIGNIDIGAGDKSYSFYLRTPSTTPSGWKILYSNYTSGKYYVYFGLNGNNIWFRFATPTGYKECTYTYPLNSNLLITVNLDRDGLMTINENGTLKASVDISIYASVDHVTYYDTMIGKHTSGLYYNSTLYALEISNAVKTVKQMKEGSQLAKGWTWDGVGSIANDNFRQVVSAGGKVTQQVATVAGTPYEQIVESVGAGIVTTAGQDGDHVVTLQDDTYVSASVKNQAIIKEVDPAISTNIVTKHLIHNVE